MYKMKYDRACNTPINKVNITSANPNGALSLTNDPTNAGTRK